jgi:hydroxymethylglutaryl-CoA reductase
MSNNPFSSRIPGFFKLPLDERQAILTKALNLTDDELKVLRLGGIDPHGADQIVENVIGIYTLPLGVGLNFQVNGVDRFIPMAVEEPSVIAAASNAARMVREGGGFQAKADESVMTTQIELRAIADETIARATLEAAQSVIMTLADQSVPRLKARGGGCRGMDVRPLGAGRMVVHLHIDCLNAMGANLVNTVAEAVAPHLAHMTGAKMGLRILTNLSDRRLVKSTCSVPFATLDQDPALGAQIAHAIEAASRFAEDDVYRAATHNKGILNGIDPVVIATGNDWRGVEAGAHAYAARNGYYRPLATWRADDTALCGQLEMPMALGTAGGTLQVHPGARLALKILGVTEARTLAEIIASVGLAQNLAALRALATEGIQRGHMALHHRATDRAHTNGDVE